MNAFAIGCIAFATGCFAALGLRLLGVGRRDDIAAGMRELLLARQAGSIAQGEFEQQQQALQRELIETSSAANGLLPRVLLPVLVAALASAIYAWTAVRPSGPSLAADADDMQSLARQLARKVGEGAPEKPPAGDLRDLVKSLAAKMERDPKNGAGWALLGRTYANIQQFAEAEGAFEKAVALQQGDSALYADWAEAHFMALGRKWDKRALELIGKALAADPRNLKALTLAGTEAMDRSDYRKAVTYWSQLLAAAPPGSEEARQAEAKLAQIKALAGGKSPATTNSPGRPGATP